MSRGKKMGLGDFLGDKAAVYIPEAALPSGPRARTDDDDGGYGGRGGGRGGYGDDRRGGYEREASRSDQSDQWRGDRSAGASGGFGGDRFGDRGGDRFGGGSRFDRPSSGYSREPEERPAHMRLNLQRRTGDSAAPASGRGDDKWSNAFGSRGGDRDGGRFGGDRDGGRFGGDRDGGRFGGDRDGGRFGDRDGGRFGDRDSGRFGGDRGGRFGDRDSGRFGDRDGGRFGDRPSGGYSSRFDREEPRGVSSSFGNMRVSEQAAPAAPVDDKKARAQQMREERKKKAEEERKAAEEAKRLAAEEKKRQQEEAAKKAEKDRVTMQKVLATGKTGEALAAAAKDIFKASGRPSGAVLFETVLVKAEDVAKASANWIAPTAFGELLKLGMEGADKADQLQALYALQTFLNGHDFPKGVLEKCFMALYSVDIIEDAAFFEYKYDVDSDAPGRMKAIIQTSTWLTWLETPEEESEDEEDDE